MTNSWLFGKQEFNYEGTKVLIERGDLVITGLFLISFILFLPLSPPMALAFLLIGLWPYAHELAHYYTAREHGFEVSLMTFGKKNETTIEGSTTHRDVMDIALAGELANAIFIIGMAICIMVYALEVALPWLGIFGFMFIVAWIATWLIPGSDMNVAIRAYEYYQAQQGTA